MLQPLGMLGDRLETGIAFGGGLRATYAARTDLLLLLHYSQGTVAEGWGLHQLFAEAGLGQTLRGPVPLVVAGGPGLFFLRAEVPQGGLLLDDNETDFGHWVRLEGPELREGRWRAALYGQWSAAWTRPEWSQFAWFGMRIGWRAW